MVKIISLVCLITFFSSTISIPSGFAAEKDFLWTMFTAATTGANQVEITIAKIPNANSSIVALVTNKEGKESVAVIGDKDSEGKVIRVTGYVYLSPNGKFLKLNLDSSGLPVSLVDDSGKKLIFSNINNNRVTITVYDKNDNQLAAPKTVAINQNKITESQQLDTLLARSLQVDQRYAPYKQSVSDSSSAEDCTSRLQYNAILSGVKGAGLVLSATLCAASIATLIVPAIIAACGSTFLGTLAILPLVDNENEAFQVAGVASTKIDELACITTPINPTGIVSCMNIFAEKVVNKIYKPCDETIPAGTQRIPFPRRPSDAWLGIGLGGNGNGVVTSTPAGINCPGDCSNIYSVGTRVSLTATEQAGAAFRYWSGACSGSSATVTVEMAWDKACTAIFQESPFQDSWSGSYSYTNLSGDGGCRYDSAGNFSATINVNGNTISGTAFMDGFQLRWIPGCDLYGYTSSTGTISGTISGNTASGSFSFSIAETGGTWAPSFNATLNGDILSGTLEAGGSGTFTMNRQ